MADPQSPELETKLPQSSPKKAAHMHQDFTLNQIVHVSNRFQDSHRPMGRQRSTCVLGVVELYESYINPLDNRGRGGAVAKYVVVGPSLNFFWLQGGLFC